MTKKIERRAEIADTTNNVNISRLPAPIAQNHARLCKLEMTLPLLQQALQQL